MAPRRTKSPPKPAGAVAGEAAREATTAPALVAEDHAPSRAVVKGSEHPVAPVGVKPVTLEPMPASPRRRRGQRLAAALLVAAALVFGARFGHDWLVRGQFIVSTDDAYVRSDVTVIAPKVAGYAAAVLVAENAKVKAGELLVAIEPGDYQIAVDAARAKIATQDATMERIGRQIAAQKAVVARARAQLRAAEADLTRAAADLERTRQLAERAISSRKLLDTARAEHARAIAAVESAEAAILTAEANVGVFAAQREEARRVRAEYATALRKAERDLAATEIRAPFDGVVGNLSVKPGQLLAPGSRMLALVPLDKVYVEANFKETQIAGLKVGQPVEIAVDAYDTHPVRGRIVSISPAAGQEFSILPPQNATGNFTKIVQRVPVRISIPTEVAARGHLRPGLSVVVSVDTHDPSRPRPTLLGVLGLERPEATAGPARK